MAHDFATHEARKIALEHAVNIFRDLRPESSEATNGIVDAARKFEAFLLDKPGGDDVDLTTPTAIAYELRKLKRQLGGNLGLA